jgi:hypothetical protein
LCKELQSVKNIAATISLSVALFTQTANASENWTCTYKDSSAKEPTLVSYQLAGNDLTQVWPSGTTSSFQVVQNNEYGLVGISSISEVEPNQAEPTVGAFTVVINRQTKEFWLATTIAKQPALNEIVHGPCVKK